MLVLGVFIPETNYPDAYRTLEGKQVNYTEDDVLKWWRFEKVEPAV